MRRTQELQSSFLVLALIGLKQRRLLQVSHIAKVSSDSAIIIFSHRDERELTKMTKRRCDELMSINLSYRLQSVNKLWNLKQNLVSDHFKTLQSFGSIKYNALVIFTLTR
jgi:hypothetical protein